MTSISATQAGTPAMARPAAPCAATCASLEEPTPGGGDSLDLAVIDTAQKAALVPALIPPMLLTTMAGMSYAAQGGDSYDVGMAEHVGDAAAAQMAYHMDAGSSAPHLDGQGTYAGLPAQESYSLDATGFHVTGSLGSNLEHLDVTAADGGVVLLGTVGSVQVNERITPHADGNGSTFDGFLNDVPVHEVLTLVPPDGEGLPRFHLEGTVGDAPIAADETITPGDEAGIVLHLDGIVAGQPVRYDHSVLSTHPQRS